MPRPTDRTTIHRHPERSEDDRAVLCRILDDALARPVAWVDPDGRPRALPTIHARIDDTLYLHGSRAARAGRALRAAPSSAWLPRWWTSWCSRERRRTIR